MYICCLANINHKNYYNNILTQFFLLKELEYSYKLIKYLYYLNHLNK